jgi:hypothetical protein
VLAGVGVVAGPLLQSGRIRLAGAVPNGQHFQANPRLTWMVKASRAQIMHHDAGPIGPLERQPRLGDLWLPQRGIFFVGEAYVESLDASRHWTVQQVALRGAS